MMQAAIAAATTLEEVERLNRLLQTGQVPGLQNGTAQQRPGRHIAAAAYIIATEF